MDNADQKRLLDMAGRLAGVGDDISSRRTRQFSHVMIVWRGSVELQRRMR